MLITNPEFVRDCLTNAELFKANSRLDSVPAPSSIKQHILMEFCLQYLTNDLITFVKMNGAEVKPNGRTVKRKYFVSPLTTQEKPVLSYLSPPRNY